ncbi:hypothetical protein FWK35_00036967 [Aphis craccivora]|uniref:Uncharacterized protein n=1 Tax=Aphis craccivora TaxID=307492 RepID=A0A6G0Y2I6_APHCR|nr:hypothetical protein FWK35_00036967 [Aphis craccivora]
MLTVTVSIVYRFPMCYSLSISIVF